MPVFIPKRIAAFVAAVVVAIPAAPAAYGYDELCLRNHGNFHVYYRVNFKDRGGRANYSLGRFMTENVDFNDVNDRAGFSRNRAAIWNHPDYERSPPVGPGETHCISKAGLNNPNPGEAFSVKIFFREGYSLRTGADHTCRLAENKRRWNDANEPWHRVLVWPDGGGKLQFHAWGEGFLEKCAVESGERMWSQCALGREGFRKSACYPWRPLINPNSAYDLTADTAKGIAYLASVARRGANLDVRVDNQHPLHLAVELNREDHMQVLLGQGAYLTNPVYRAANTSVRNGVGETPLAMAVRMNRPNLVRVLLQVGADVALKDNRGRTPLLIAAMDYAGQPGAADNLVLPLLAAGANANATDKSGNRPLQMAARGGDAEAAGLLVSHGADTYRKDSSQRTALQYAWEGSTPGHAEVAKLLFQDNLRQAMRRKDQERIRELPSYAGREWADFNAPIEGEAPPILWAYQLEFLDAATVLSAVDGVNLEAANDAGRRAIHYAAEHSHIASLLALLDNGANINAADSDGKTPLMIAAQFNHIEAAQLLISRQADLDLADAAGQTALDIATSLGNPETELVVLDAGGARATTADTARAVDAADNPEQNTILHQLARDLDEARLRAILERQPRVGKTNRNGDTALMLAVRENANDSSAAVAHALLAAGANPNQFNGDHTLAELAARRDEPRLLRALLDYGVNPNGVSGRTPLAALAAVRNAGRAIEVLAEYGAALDWEVDGSTLPDDVMENIPNRIPPPATRGLRFRPDSGNHVFTGVTDILGHAAYAGANQAVRALMASGKSGNDPRIGRLYHTPTGDTAAELALKRGHDAVLLELAQARWEFTSDELAGALNNSRDFPLLASLLDPARVGGLPVGDTPTVPFLIRYIDSHPNDYNGLMSLLYRGLWRSHEFVRGDSDYGSPNQTGKTATAIPLYITRRSARTRPCGQFLRPTPTTATNGGQTRTA